VTATRKSQAMIAVLFEKRELPPKDQVLGGCRQPRLKSENHQTDEVAKQLQKNLYEGDHGFMMPYVVP
jgi:hypothetical protein